MRRLALLSAIVVVGLTAAGVAAQRGGGRGPGIPPTGTIENIRANLYRIPGAGPNTLVFVTQNGVVLVDTKLPGNGDAILKQVRTVTDKPVTMILSTHAHPDHLGSNDFFPATVEFVTHENAQKSIAANPKYSTMPTMTPDRTFSDRLTIGEGADRIDLHYFGPGHTNGDAFIVFPAVRAMALGDQMAWKMAPLIDGASGGSVVALPDSLEKAVKGVQNVDTVIEGHGDVNTFAGFREYAQFSRALLEAARAGRGKQTAEEVAAGLRQKFPVFTKDELLPGLEYGGTPLSRAVLNINIAFKELAAQ